MPELIRTYITKRPWLFFLVWAAACSFVYWAFGPYSYVRIPDNADSTLAAKLGIAHSVVEYGFTWWWTVALSGGSLMAKGVAGLIDTLPFLVLPGWLAYGLIMFLQRWLAGWFTYRALRDTTDVEPLPSLYAGMAYALFAQAWLSASWEGFTMYDGLGLPALPLMIWALYKLSQRKHSGVVFAVILGVFFAVAANPVFTVFLWPTAVGWLLVVARVSWRQLRRSLLFAGLAYVIVAGVLNFPTLMRAPYSYRANWTAEAQWYGWEYHLRFFRDMFAANLLPVILIILGSVASLFNDKRLTRTLLLLGAVLFIVAAKPLYTVLAAEVLGFFNGVAFERFFLGLPFLFLAAGAMGLQAISTRFQRNRLLGGAVVSLVIFVVLLQYVDQTRRILRWMVAGSNYAALFEQPQVRKLAETTRNDQPFRVATIMAHRYLVSQEYGLLPQYNAAFAWGAGLETADGYAYDYPQQYQDYWVRVMSPMFKAWPAYKHGYEVRGNRAELFLPVEVFASPTDTVVFKDYFKLDALSELNVRYIISNFPVHDERLALVSDGREYLEERDGGKSTTVLLEEFLKGKRYLIPVYIYENTQARPRLYIDPDTLNARLNMKYYSPDELRLRVDSPSAGTLVHSACYDPGWIATVNGVEQILQPYLGALQGIAVPAGEYEVVLRYTGW